MLTFTGEKGALTHQLAGCTLSVGAGKQDLCWGWHPCPGSHTALPSSLPPALRVCGGCGCCSWANLQYFAQLGIRAIAYFRVALAGHVLPLSQREKVKNSDLLESTIKSSAWCDTWSGTHRNTASGGWKGVWVALEGHEWQKRKISLRSKSLNILRNQIFSATTKKSIMFIPFMFMPLISHLPDFTEMSNFSQTLLGSPKFLTELNLRPALTPVLFIGVTLENRVLLGGLSAASTSFIAVSSPELVETRWCWDGTGFYEKAIVFPSWLHLSAARVKLLAHTPWLLACARSPK